MTERDTVLSDEQLARLNLLVQRAYCRMYHDFRPMSPEKAIRIQAWTIDVREGRDAWDHAAKVVTGEIKESPYA